MNWAKLLQKELEKPLDQRPEGGKTTKELCQEFGCGSKKMRSILRNLQSEGRVEIVHGLQFSKEYKKNVTRIWYVIKK